MFESEISAFGLEGARPEFYSCLPGPAAGDFLPYLTRDYLAGVNERYLDLPEEAFEALCAAGEALAARPALCRLAAYGRSLLFESGYNEDYLAWLGFPRAHTGVQPLDDLFGLLVHLSGAETVAARYQARGVPETYMRASYRTVRIWMESFHTFYGRWGFDRERPRMVYVEHLRIIRIGRLEFETNWFAGKLVVLRSRTDGSVTAMSEGGLPVRADGQLCGTNEIWDPNCRFTVYDETADWFKGQILLPEGRVSEYVSVCMKDEWEAAARRGQNSVNIHIPRDGRLDVDEARRSVLEAAQFYPAYFPERDFRVFECHTWLFDQQLAGLLGEQSNIVRFQRLFYRFPEATSDLGVRTGAFTEAPFDILTWTPATTLQSRVCALYKAGGRLYAEGGFLLPDGEMPPKQKN